MAFTYIPAPPDPRLRQQQLALQLIGQGIGGFAQQAEQRKAQAAQQQLLSDLGLTGKMAEAAVLSGQVGPFLQQALRPPETPKPPQTRNILEGNERVFQQFDPTSGQFVEVGRGPAFAPPTQIHVGDEKPFGSGAGAALATQAPAALSGLEAAIAGIMNPDGSINRTNVLLMNTPGVGAIPLTKGTELRRNFDNGIDLLLRSRSGAALSEDDIESIKAIYLPNPLDSDEAIRQKLIELPQVLEAARRGEFRGRGGEVPELPATDVARPSEEQGVLEQGLNFLQGLMGGSAPPDFSTFTPQQAIDYVDNASDAELNALTPDQRRVLSELVRRFEDAR